jgi:hypothetical protein
MGLQFEDIEEGVVYQGASGQRRKVLKMEGYGKSRIVTYEITVSCPTGSPVGTQRTRHIGPFMLWAKCIIE